MWTCYTCGQKGHKSPQCPQKGVGVKSPGPVTVKKERTQVRTMRDHTWKKEDTNIVNGKVGCQEVPFVLDTGALI